MSPLARVASAVILLSLAPLAQPVHAICPDGPFDLSNVTWIFADSLATCPAGDSLLFTHSSLHKHPSRLRIIVGYYDEECDPRVGVRPESLWVSLSNFTSTLKVNDEAEVTYADDSTDTGGGTRITIPTFSGCGTARVTLYVSGVSQGFKTVRVRSVDTDGDGRVTSSDLASLSDVNYNGGTTASDTALVAAHADHWHRNALHGTLVRRTNLCETCGHDSLNTKGEGQVFWSPSGRYISYTAFVDAGVGQYPACKVFIVPSDPVAGNAVTQLTFDPISYHDYDPSWSPLNDAIIFDRGDSVIISRTLPWVGNTETAITASDSCGGGVGDDYPSISPNGQWVAFSRCNGAPTGGWSLWKVPIEGGAATQLTSAVGVTDFYASWSPDGETIYFQRDNPSTTEHWNAWKVPLAGGSAEEVFAAQSSPLFDAVQPGSSPDDSVLIMGYGERSPVVRNVITHTFDPTLPSSSGAVIANFADTTFAQKSEFPILSPRVSPDGTRLVLGSKQVWAARRNMNLPPAFTSVTSSEEGTRSILDTTATMNFSFTFGNDNEITVSASDPEDDDLAYRTPAFQADWMSWDSGSQTLSGSPPFGAIGSTFYVKFRVTTLSGGTDSFIAAITVANSLRALSRTREDHFLKGPNPTRGVFAVSAPVDPRVAAHLLIFDLSGRLVAVIDRPQGGQLVWKGRDRRGALARSGVYLWRLDSAQGRREGRVVVVR